MSRIIKFRIWNEGGKNMLYDIDNVFECLKQQIKFDKLMPCRGFVVGYDHRTDGMVWMQFTNLVDKNGVEIYDGDILHAGDRIVKVIWHEHAGQWDTIFIRYQGEKTSNGMQNLDWKYRATVIGNIYENPELLKP